jgi:hypothetical protein
MEQATEKFKKKRKKWKKEVKRGRSKEKAR